KVLSVADVFCDLTLVSPHSAGCTALEAVNRMEALYTEEMDKKAFAALKAIALNSPIHAVS
ncbi:MAG: hypothetical protein V4692_01700, partial [Bdellovibrionota bacterium]